MSGKPTESQMRRMDARDRFVDVTGGWLDVESNRTGLPRATVRITGLEQYGHLGKRIAAALEHEFSNDAHYRVVLRKRG